MYLVLWYIVCCVESIKFRRLFTDSLVLIMSRDIPVLVLWYFVCSYRVESIKFRRLLTHLLIFLSSSRRLSAGLGRHEKPCWTTGSGRRRCSCPSRFDRYGAGANEPTTDHPAVAARLGMRKLPPYITQDKHTTNYADTEYHPGMYCCCVTQKCGMYVCTSKCVCVSSH